MLKLADKTSNLRSLAASPPTDWPADRCVEYIEWSSVVVAGCRGHNAWLKNVYNAAMNEARLALTGAARPENDNGAA